MPFTPKIEFKFLLVAVFWVFLEMLLAKADQNFLLFEWLVPLIVLKDLWLIVEVPSHFLLKCRIIMIINFATL